jgi:hypothetical protein
MLHLPAGACRSQSSVHPGQRLTREYCLVEPSRHVPSNVLLLLQVLQGYSDDVTCMVLRHRLHASLKSVCPVYLWCCCCRCCRATLMM